MLCGDLSEADVEVAKSDGGDVGGTWLQLMCCALPVRICFLSLSLPDYVISTGPRVKGCDWCSGSSSA